jgi:uncharacterized protein (DUF885 family)
VHPEGVTSKASWRETGEVTAVGDLADRFYAEWLAAHPLAASALGVVGYDHQLPDMSEQGEAERRARISRLGEEARSLARADNSDEEAVTLSCIAAHAAQGVSEIDSAALEYTVTPMPYSGPAELLAVLARTVLNDGQSAEDYLSRLRASGEWIDQHAQRLRAGARKGRTPVMPLVERAIAWAKEVLRQAVPEAVTSAAPPPGGEAGPNWPGERDRLATEVLTPALKRWVSTLEDLLPESRPADRPGLAGIPDGDAYYEAAIRTHTTLPLRADDLHRRGLEEIASLEDRALELGDRIRLSGLDEVLEAIRSSSQARRPQEAIDLATRAIRRAEARLEEAFNRPLPPPCAVSAMPRVVGASGAAPHYTPPRRDGTRPGTFWFNTEVATAGTGWDLEGVAFHEAVPGHHMQLSRVQVLEDVPELQRVLYVTAFSEGWALYAEQLAEEMGLYSDIESTLGAVSAGLMRAARLVIDTGLHALGWSRDRALEFFAEHVPMPMQFLEDEVDRYIAWPGQALAYLTGKHEILVARERATSRLRGRFSLPEFHSALLNSGSLPMPVMHEHIGRWLDRSSDR